MDLCGSGERNKERRKGEEAVMKGTRGEGRGGGSDEEDKKKGSGRDR